MAPNKECWRRKARDFPDVSSIQIKNAPDDVHARLRERAAHFDKSLLVVMLCTGPITVEPSQSMSAATAISRLAATDLPPGGHDTSRLTASSSPATPPTR